MAGASGQDAGNGACDGGDCALPACLPEQRDCNGRAEDGCEARLDSLGSCGGCGIECTNEHGATACSSTADGGQACVPTCALGYADCDLNPNNGCETNIDTDSVNCGKCGAACPANGGTPQCQAGKCGLSSCNSGFGDCSNAGSCSFNLNSDPKNCGSCGHQCSSEHGTPACNAGVCRIECDAGWGDCNAAVVDAGQPPEDGCETKLNELDSGGSVPNCGGCGQVCTRRSLTTVDVASCAMGVCARNCFDDATDCDGNRNDPSCHGSSCGCETHLASSAGNCGACGHVCQGGACNQGACQCPDTKPKGGSACTLDAAVTCGPYAGCTCACTAGLFQCTC